MEQGRIVIVTGTPGTGKTTVASILARESSLCKSVLLHTDDFYGALRKGAVPPQMPEANEQNRVVIEAFLEAAKCFARGGYDVIVDGVIGPWFLAPFQEAARQGYEIHYIILRASREETLRRAVGRDKLDRKANRALVEAMWPQFQELGEYEENVIDTTGYTVQETVERVLERIEERRMCIP